MYALISNDRPPVTISITNHRGHLKEIRSSIMLGKRHLKGRQSKRHDMCVREIHAFNHFCTCIVQGIIFHSQKGYCTNEVSAVQAVT